MKFDDDDLKDGKLWAALQKEIDRDLTENGNGETFQKELEDIEDSIETENEKEAFQACEDRIDRSCVRAGAAASCGGGRCHLHQQQNEYALPPHIGQLQHCGIHSGGRRAVV